MANFSDKNYGYGLHGAISCTSQSKPNLLNIFFPQYTFWTWRFNPAAIRPATIRSSIVNSRRHGHHPHSSAFRRGRLSRIPNRSDRLHVYVTSPGVVMIAAPAPGFRFGWAEYDLADVEDVHRAFFRWAYGYMLLWKVRQIYNRYIYQSISICTYGNTHLIVNPGCQSVNPGSWKPRVV